MSVQIIDREKSRLDARKRAENDLYFLVTEILEWGQGRGGPPVEPDFHQPLCRWIEDTGMKSDGRIGTVRQLLWPRYHGKTTFFTTADNIRWSLRVPDICVAIGHASKEDAEDIVRQIRSEYENKKWLKWIAPDICFANPEKESGMWNQDAFVLKRRHANKTPSFQAVSPEAMPTGMHFHIWHWDDLVTERNVGTHEQRVKHHRAIGLARPYVPDRMLAYTKISGTRWHLHDAYGKLIDAAQGAGAKEEQTPVGVRLRSRAFDCLTATMLAPDGQPWLKQFYAVEKSGPDDERLTLAELRTQMGSTIFDACMMQKPVAEGTAAFKVDDIRRWNSWGPGKSGWSPPVEGRQWRYFTAVDFNIKTNETGDHAVVLTCAKSDKGEMAVVGMNRGHPAQAEIADWIEEHMMRWTPERVFVETSGYQETFLQLLNERRIKNGIYIPYEAVGRGGRGAQTKQQRIMALQGAVEARRVYVPEGRGFDAIVKEFEEFSQDGKVQMDDCLDCLADIYRLGGWAAPKVTEQERRQVPFGAVLAEQLLGIQERRIDQVVQLDGWDNVVSL